MQTVRWAKAEPKQRGWNAHFFYFLGFLCGAVAFERSQPLFLEPIIRLNDEAFHDALAPLLNGLDQATPLDRSGNPAQPAAVSVSFADGHKQDDGRDMQWRERAIVMAAALAARNYEGDNRAEIEMWSRPILQRAATQAADR